MSALLTHRNVKLKPSFMSLENLLPIALNELDDRWCFFNIDDINDAGHVLNLLFHTCNKTRTVCKKSLVSGCEYIDVVIDYYQLKCTTTPYTHNYETNTVAKLGKIVEEIQTKNWTAELTAVAVEYGDFFFNSPIRAQIDIVNFLQGLLTIRARSPAFINKKLHMFIFFLLTPLDLETTNALFMVTIVLDGYVGLNF